MRNYRNALAALVFALVFTMPAFAGIMYPEKTPPPPTPSATGIMTTDLTDGIMHTDVAAPEPTTSDSATEIALSLLQNALTLF
jgi:hypothetical protein